MAERFFRACRINVSFAVSRISHGHLRTTGCRLVCIPSACYPPDLKHVRSPIHSLPNRINFLYIVFTYRFPFSRAPAAITERHENFSLICVRREDCTLTYQIINLLRYLFMLEYIKFFRWKISGPTFSRSIIVRVSRVWVGFDPVRFSTKHIWM